MKTSPLLVSIAAVLISTLSLTAASPKSYQVTGPVLEVTDSLIVVQKGDERWEIIRTPDTKITGDLKVGSKVTISYTMSATKVELK